MIRYLPHPSTHPVHAQRRRWLLWFPLMMLGMGILTWQITSASPIYVLVGAGILCVLPWVVDGA